MRISIDTFESLARLAGAASLLALYKLGRGSGRHRARERATGANLRSARSSSPKGSSPGPDPGQRSLRERWRLHVIVAGLWIALSIVLLSYATIEGELAFADLDGLDLIATYTWSPIDRP